MGVDDSSDGDGGNSGGYRGGDGRLPPGRDQFNSANMVTGGYERTGIKSLIWVINVYEFDPGPRGRSR